MIEQFLAYHTFNSSPPGRSDVILKGLKHLSVHVFTLQTDGTPTSHDFRVSFGVADWFTVRLAQVKIMTATAYETRKRPI